MEFDTATLRPTYRLAWGQAGASCALDIAASLGFDSGVLAEARQLLAAQQRAQAAAAVGGGSSSSAGASMEEVAVSIEQQLEELQGELEEVQRQRAAAEGALADVTEAVAALRTTQ
jgi:DNA mismatch repair protein MutS2